MDVMYRGAIRDGTDGPAVNEGPDPPRPPVPGEVRSSVGHNAERMGMECRPRHIGMNPIRRGLDRRSVQVPIPGACYQPASRTAALAPGYPVGSMIDAQWEASRNPTSPETTQTRKSIAGTRDQPELGDACARAAQFDAPERRQPCQ